LSKIKAIEDQISFW